MNHEIDRETIDPSLDTCQNEWEQLKDATNSYSKIYFRKNIAFYYTDLKQIRLGLLRDSNLTNLKYKLIIQINKQKNYSTLTQYQMINFEKIHYDMGSVKNVVAFEFIEANFSINQQTAEFNSINCMQIKIIAENELFYFQSENFIHLTVKAYLNETSSKQHSMICSNFYSKVSNELLNKFKWWFKINKISGYSKIVLFNHTFDQRFNDLFLKHENFIQIIQYQCVSNFYTINLTNLRFVKFNQIKNMNVYQTRAYFYRLALQVFAVNECYLLNKDKYK